MKVDDLAGVQEVCVASELSAALMRRHGPSVNEFWLSHENKYPAMTIWVKDVVATLHYFPREGHPGFRSLGDVAQAEQETVFCTESVWHTESVSNKFVVPFVVAMAAALEFLLSKELPRSVNWMEL